MTDAHTTKIHTLVRSCPDQNSLKLSKEPKSDFPTLNYLNYGKWVTCMEVEDSLKGLKAEEWLEEEEKKKRDKGKMVKACTEIILRVQDLQMIYMTSEDPMVIWEELVQVYVPHRFAMRLVLQRQFSRLVKSVEYFIRAEQRKSRPDRDSF